MTKKKLNLARSLQPLATRDYRLLFAAVGIEVFGTGVWTIVMVFQVLAIDDSPLALSAVATGMSLGLFEETGQIDNPDDHAQRQGFAPGLIIGRLRAINRVGDGKGLARAVGVAQGIDGRGQGLALADGLPEERGVESCIWEDMGQLTAFTCRFGIQRDQAGRSALAFGLPAGQGNTAQAGGLGQQRFGVVIEFASAQLRDGVP